MEYLLQLSAHPLVIGLSVIAASWIWEDAAVITGALLAVDGKLSIPFALTVVLIGIVTGDMALYYLGRLAHRWRGLRGWIMLKPHCRYMSKRFKQKTMLNILYIRFIPGLRTLGFTLCGLWKVPQFRFFVAMGVAGTLWVGVIFYGVYQIGSASFLQNSNWKWSLMLVALLLLVFNNYLSYQKHKRKVTS